MGTSLPQSDYLQVIKAIKDAIQASRLRASHLVNRELLSLYYAIGKYISLNSHTAQWGTGAIAAISQSLQQELPGLRGFSEGNMRKMRIFYEEWCSVFDEEIRALSTHKFIVQADTDVIRPSLTNENIIKHFRNTFITDEQI